MICQNSRNWALVRSLNWSQKCQLQRITSKMFPHQHTQHEDHHWNKWNLVGWTLWLKCHVGWSQALQEGQAGQVSWKGWNTAWSQRWQADSLCIRIKGQKNNVDVIVGVYYRPPIQDNDSRKLLWGTKGHLQNSCPCHTAAQMGPEQSEIWVVLQYSN